MAESPPPRPGMWTSRRRWASSSRPPRRPRRPLQTRSTRSCAHATTPRASRRSGFPRDGNRRVRRDRSHGPRCGVHGAARIGQRHRGHLPRGVVTAKLRRSDIEAWTFGHPSFGQQSSQSGVPWRGTPLLWNARWILRRSAPEPSEVRPRTFRCRPMTAPMSDSEPSDVRQQGFRSRPTKAPIPDSVSST